MKRLIALFLLLPLVAFGQLLPIQRNFFTTNPAPVVDVVAGSNATVVATLVGSNTRRFTVSSTAGGMATNVYGTNVVGAVPEATHATNADASVTSTYVTTATLTNKVYGTNVTGAVAEATHATNADNSTYVTTATLTNQVYGTNVVGYVSEASHATNADNSTFVTTATITNKVYGTNVVGFVSEASHATNADNAMYGTNATYVLTATLTNQIYASNVVSGGQLPLGTVATNTGWNGAFLQYSNTARVWGANGDQLTNSSGYSLLSMADTNWVLSQVAQFGAYEYFGGPTNTFAITNTGETVSRTNVSTCSISPFVNASTSTISSLVLNAYARHAISTNKFQRIAAGPVAIETYPFRSGGGGTVSGHYELYAVDCVSNIMYELGSGPTFIISATAPALVTTSFVITNGFTATNLCYACVAFKVDSAGSGGPSLSWAHGGTYAAHLNFARPLSSATIDGSQVVGPVTNAYNAVYATNWTVITNTASAGNIPVATSASSAKWNSDINIGTLVVTNAPILNLGSSTNLLSTSITFSTNSWALNTALPWGTNHVLSSGATTGGITGISGFPDTGGYVELNVKATGDIVFTNATMIAASDFADSRTITNGNTACIAVELIPGVTTNLAIVQFK